MTQFKTSAAKYCCFTAKICFSLAEILLVLCWITIVANFLKLAKTFSNIPAIVLIEPLHLFLALIGQGWIIVIESSSRDKFTPQEVWMQRKL